MASHYAVMTEPHLHPAAVDALRLEFDHGNNNFTITKTRAVSFILSITSSNAEMPEITGYLENVAAILPADVPPFMIVLMTDGERPIMVRMASNVCEPYTAETPWHANSD